MTLRGCRLPACMAALVAALAVPAVAQRSATRAPAPAVPVVHPHNQFITVHEMINARRAPNTAVSVEGYFVVAIRQPDGAVRAWLVDSVDKVLSAQEADAMARTGATLSVPSAFIRQSARRAWCHRGLQRFVMYTGTTRAQVNLNDTMPKVRVTARTVRGRGALGPAARIEFMDDNGHWRAM
ncbi:MAG TPA: hypothetical protein VLH79_15435 [Chthonomonadales bacterium]|nr:hypothetical protein [Chthonomonadales bacterium]